MCQSLLEITISRAQVNLCSPQHHAGPIGCHACPPACSALSKSGGLHVLASLNVDGSLSWLPQLSTWTANPSMPSSTAGREQANPTMRERIAHGQRDPALHVMSEHEPLLQSAPGQAAETGAPTIPADGALHQPTRSSGLARRNLLAAGCWGVVLLCAAAGSVYSLPELPVRSTKGRVVPIIGSLS